VVLFRPQKFALASVCYSAFASVEASGTIPPARGPSLARRRGARPTLARLSSPTTGPQPCVRPHRRLPAHSLRSAAQSWPVEPGKCKFLCGYDLHRVAPYRRRPSGPHRRNQRSGQGHDIRGSAPAAKSRESILRVLAKFKSLAPSRSSFKQILGGIAGCWNTDHVHLRHLRILQGPFKMQRKKRKGQSLFPNVT